MVAPAESARRRTPAPVLVSGCQATYTAAMSLDLALIGFEGEDAAASVFGRLRDRVGSATPWTSEVAIVERQNGDSAASV